MFPVRFLRLAFTLGALAALPGGLAGCTTSPAAPSPFAPYSQTDLRVGTGPAVIAGNFVTVNYTGWFYDPDAPGQKGAAFDTSLGQAPLQFLIGTTTVIFAWNQGVPGMQIGGLRRLVIPPSLAFGGFRTGPVPAWTTTVFEIELLAIE